MGNSVGSDILNILGILDLSAVIYPTPFEGSITRNFYILKFATAIIFGILFIGTKP